MRYMRFFFAACAMALVTSLVATLASADARAGPTTAGWDASGNFENYKDRGGTQVLAGGDVLTFKIENYALTTRGIGLEPGTAGTDKPMRSHLLFGNSAGAARQSDALEVASTRIGSASSTR